MATAKEIKINDHCDEVVKKYREYKREHIQAPERCKKSIW
jgi:hypothetical protein